MSKKKSLPVWIRSDFIKRLLRSDSGVIFSYWLFQGMLYMDYREALVKIVLDILMVCLLILARCPVFIAVIVAHTINMFLNGHFYAMRSHMARGQTTPDAFISYVAGLEKRLSSALAIDGAAAYGSLSLNRFNPSSDIDIRVFPSEGPFGWLKAIMWVITERTRAVFSSFPLDIYFFDLSTIDEKMRADEPPIIFCDREGKLAAKYPNHVKYVDFERRFRSEYVK